MTDAELLAKVKMACRITATNTSFDEELKDLINSAFLDLSISDVNTAAGVQYTAGTATDDIVLAVKMFVKYHFGDLLTDNEKQTMKASYDEQKAQLKMKRYSTIV